MDDIVIEYNPTLKDHLHAHRVHYRHGVFWKIDKAVALLLAACGVVLVSVGGPVWWYFILFPLALAEWFNGLDFRALQIRWMFKHHPQLRERYALTFSEQGLHFRTSTVDSRLAWSYYRRLLESDRVFLLVYGKGMYSTIPKSAFKDADEIGRFRRLVTEKLSVREAG